MSVTGLNDQGLNFLMIIWIFIPWIWVSKAEPRDEKLPAREYFLSLIFVSWNFVFGLSTVERERSLLWAEGFFSGLEIELPGKIPIFPALFFPCHHPEGSKRIFHVFMK